LRSRKHNRRIIIERPTLTDDSYGEPIESFATYVARWAQVDASIGKESFNGYQEQNEYPVKFTVRYDSLTKAVTEDMRVNFESKYYDIEAIVNYNHENREIHIYGKNRGT